MAIGNEDIQGSLNISKHLNVGGDGKIEGSLKIGHDCEVAGWLKSSNILGACKGLFSSLDKLEAVYPRPEDGCYAYVGNSLPADLYVAEGGRWINTGSQGGDRIGIVIGDHEDFSWAIGSIDISELDNISIDCLLGKRPNRLRVLFGDVVVGILDIIADPALHGLTQILWTHYELGEDGELTTDHLDGKVWAYIRTFKLGSGGSLDPGWSAWKVFQPDNASTSLDGLMSKEDKAKLNMMPMFVLLEGQFNNTSTTLSLSADANFNALDCVLGKKMAFLKLTNQISSQQSALIPVTIFSLSNVFYFSFIYRNTIYTINNFPASGNVSHTPFTLNSFALDAVASQTEDGLMSAKDKKKLDKIEEEANKYELPIADASKLGGVKSKTTGKTPDRDYNVEVLSDGSMKVNVPWPEQNSYGDASESSHGLMSVADKKKLNGMPNIIMLKGTLSGNSLTIEEKDGFSVADCISGKSVAYLSVNQKALDTTPVTLQLNFYKLGSIAYMWFIHNGAHYAVWNMPQDNSYSTAPLTLHITNFTLNASQTSAGLMSTDDKKKLDGIKAESLIGKISFQEMLDMNPADIVSKGDSFHKIYIVDNYGILEVFIDNMMHQVTQVLHSNFNAINNEGGSEHTDGKIYTLYRCYGMGLGGNIERGWTEWKLMQPDEATTESAGLMSATDKKKLDGIPYESPFIMIECRLNSQADLYGRLEDCIVTLVKKSKNYSIQAIGDGGQWIFLKLTDHRDNKLVTLLSMVIDRDNRFLGQFSLNGHHYVIYFSLYMNETDELELQALD